MLNKINIVKNIDVNIFRNEIKDYLIINPNFLGLIILDYKQRIKLNYNKYIPQNFNNNIIFISSNSFQQNHMKLSFEIRKYICNHIKQINNLICIGGESYIYPLICNIKNICHFTNSDSILEDSLFNNKFYNKTFFEINQLIDYNNLDDIIFPENYEYCLINISKLTIPIINKINYSNIKKIIIINCHHENFWNRIKLLSNFKLLNRKKFICYKLRYFITVNVFIKINSIISLGTNCSVGWNLNKYNLRTISYPFDWCDIKINQLIKVLDDNFKDYNNLKIKKLSENHLNEKGKSTYILNNDYNIKFAHEVLDNNKIEEFEERLFYRIEKFKKLENPIFIRIELIKVNPNKYIELDKSLKKYFSNYKLIIITDFSNELNLDNIKFIKLNKEFINWKYENFNWKDVFYKI